MYFKLDGRMLLACLALAANTVSAAERAPIVTTEQFAFYSDFETNLNDALIGAGSVVASDGQALFVAGAQKECFDGLPSSAQLGWNLAVDYYAKVVSPGGWTRRPQSLLRQQLAEVPQLPDDARSQQFLSISGGVRQAAAPAYRSCHWPDQDRANRRWIEAMIDRLEGLETPIAARLSELYGVDWHGLPLEIDVVENAPPVGANTLVLEPGGHILISNSVDGWHGFEILFHESTHTLASAWRGDPLPKSLAAAAQATNVELPRDLWHVVLFFMTGEAVSEFLVRAGNEDYETYMEVNELWQGRWGRYRDPIEAVWPDYMSGAIEMEEAGLFLLRAIGER